MTRKRRVRKLWKVGQTIRISREEPLYDIHGMRIDGKPAKILSIKQGIATIRINGKILTNFPVGYFAAPKWFSRLSSVEMKKAIKFSRR